MRLRSRHGRSNIKKTTPRRVFGAKFGLQGLNGTGWVYEEYEVRGVAGADSTDGRVGPDGDRSWVLN